MKVKVLGITRRTSANKQTGEVKVYSDIYYMYAKKMESEGSGTKSFGYKCDSITTTLDTMEITPEQLYNFEFDIKEFKDNKYKYLSEFELVKA